VIKKFLIFLVIVAGLLVVGDFMLRDRAEDAAADLIDSQISQKVDPKVDLGGFPFLRSVLTGTFERITITIPEAAEGPLVIEDIELVLEDVRLEPLAVLAGRGDLRAASLGGSGVISESTLNDIIGADAPGLTVAIEKDRVLLSHEGTTVAATAYVAGGRLFVGAGEGELGVGPFEIVLPELLPGVRFASLEATPGELVLQVAGGRLRVRT
jgi:hypothetical protein